MKRRKLWTGIAIAGVLTAGVTVAGGLRVARAAQETANVLMLPPAEQGPLRGLVRANLHRLAALRHDLHLTQEQREGVWRVIKSHHDEIVAVAKRVRDQRRLLRDLTLAEPVDEAAIRRAASDLADVIADAAVLKAKVVHEARPLLTKEQIARVDQCRRQVERSVDEFLDSPPPA